MIDMAKSKYENIRFIVSDACNIPFENEFDVVFSNAVFHWIPDQQALHKSINKALKKDGLLICEFGGYKNIENISNSFKNAINQYGDIYKSPFYFPKKENHINILVDNGFTIKEIFDYDRPTQLPNGDKGLRQWVCQFFSTDLNKYESNKQEEILSFMENELRSMMFDGKNWVADYRRLRLIATNN